MLPTLELLVSELVTNSVRHASLEESDHIDLVVTLADSYVRIEVIDPGGGFEDADAGWRRMRQDPAADRSSEAGALPEEGYGLALVNQQADRSGIGWDQGTVAWFEMGLEGT